MTIRTLLVGVGGVARADTNNASRSHSIVINHALFDGATLQANKITSLISWISLVIYAVYQVDIK